MTTCVETQTVGLHQLDNMAGLQKHPRTKAAASRYILFLSCLWFLKFLKDLENIMSSEYNVFPFFLCNQHFRMLWIPVRFPRSPALPGSPRDFLSRVVSHALPRLYHVICPPVTGFHPKARRNMACGRYIQQIHPMEWLQWLQAKYYRGTSLPGKTFKMSQSSGYPQRSTPL